MELIKKAYQINPSNLLEPWHVCDNVYFGTRGRVKLQALADNDSLETQYEGELTFLNIKVKRAKQYDKYLVDGVEKSLKEIEYDNRVKERNAEFKQLLKDNPKGKAYIMKGGLYWRPNNSGYTEIKHIAGVYDLADAISICKSSDLSRYERPILINPIEHNKMINYLIEKLTNNLIKQ